MFKPLYILMLALFVTLAGAANATSKKVAIFYNGNTEVNTQTIHFMVKQFESAKSPYELVPVQDGKAIQPGTYKAILVLNTGLKTGISRSVADFITSWKNKSEIVLISIRKDSQKITVESTPASPATLGVDGITAASTWTGRGFSAIFGGKNTAEYDMHVEWVKRVQALINKMP